MCLDTVLPVRKEHTQINGIRIAVLTVQQVTQQTVKDQFRIRTVMVNLLIYISYQNTVYLNEGQSINHKQEQDRKKM